tara:strand:- start:445 stop:837 length:393 start_codon:yes stop_codon:yes gene_type:complete
LTQTRKDKKLKFEICSRIQVFSEDFLGLNSRELAAKLDYGDPSTMRAVWNGEVLPSIEKLVALSELETLDGEKLNLNWLFTGEGNVCRANAPPNQEKNINTNELELTKMILESLERMPLHKKKGLLSIIQ